MDPNRENIINVIAAHGRRNTPEAIAETQGFRIEDVEATLSRAEVLDHHSAAKDVAAKMRAEPDYWPWSMTNTPESGDAEAQTPPPRRDARGRWASQPKQASIEETLTAGRENRATSELARSILEQIAALETALAENTDADRQFAALLHDVNARVRDYEDRLVLLRPIGSDPHIKEWCTETDHDQDTPAGLTAYTNAMRELLA